MEHISIIEIEEKYGQSLTIEKVVLFNNHRLTQDEAMRIVRSSAYSPYVIVLSKKQYMGLFLDKEPPAESNDAE